MPRIPVYDAGNLALQPTERGVDANLQAARRTGAFFNEAAGMITAGAQARVTAQNDIDRSFAGAADATATFAKQQDEQFGHREISKGAAAGAQLFDKLNNDWNETVKTADPSDPSVAAKFRETVLKPALDDFQQAYSNTDLGTRWSEQHVESMRNHFFQKTAADMSTLAADAVRVNARTLANSSANAAFKSPDFHTVDFLLNKTDTDATAIVGTSPNVKGADSAKLRTELAEKTKEQIVKAAAAGAIATAADPEKAAQSFADRYPQYITGAEAVQQARAAKVQAKTNLLQDKQLDTYQRQQEERAAHQAANKVMSDNVSYDTTTGRIQLKPDFFRQSLDIARMPNAPDGLARTMLTWGEHQQNQKAQPTISNPAVKADLYTRLFDPTNPTTEIDLMRAQVEGKLATHDFAALHQLQKTLDETPLKGEVFKDTLAAAKASLTYTMPGMPGKDPKGLANYSSFIQTFVPKYIAMSKAGTLPANALDVRDPASLISQSMAPFKRDMKTLINDRVQEMSLGAETGRQVIDQPPGAKTFVPPSNWQWSASRNQYRDPQGALYDASGNKVK